MHKKETQLLFSDQVPFWIKIGNRKTVYADWELKSREDHARMKKKRLATGMLKWTDSSQKVKDNATIHEEMEKDGEGNAGEKGEGNDEEDGEGKKTEKDGDGKKKPTAPGQKRGAEGGNEKIRITLEMRQGVRNYFDPDRDPEGYMLPTVVVFKGTWSRLDNIDDNHKWIRDETFWVGEKKIQRKAGDGAKNTMHELVEMRKKRPELFEDLVIMQQPAAFSDEIIEKWIIEDAALRVPQGLHQRDLFAAALTENAMKAMQLAQQIPCWIAPKMTPVLQLTDTDIAWPLKRHADREKAEIARDQRAVARLNGDRCIYKNLGKNDTLRLITTSVQALKKEVFQKDTIIRGLRRNGMLAYRPKFDNSTLDQGRFIATDTQLWAQDKPQGSHRMDDSWIQDRMDWLDPNGRPIPANWTQIHGCTESEKDLAEIDYCSKDKQHLQDHRVLIGGRYIDIPVLNVEADAQTLVPDSQIKDFLSPKERRLREQADRAAKGKIEGGKKANWRHQRYLERLKMKECLQAVDSSWRAHLNEELTKATRKEILQKMQTGVKGSKINTAQKKADVKRHAFDRAKKQIMKALQKRKEQMDKEKENKKKEEEMKKKEEEKKKKAEEKKGKPKDEEKKKSSDGTASDVEIIGDLAHLVSLTTIS